MLRTVLLAFALLALLVLAAVATGVHFVSKTVRDNAYTIGELETAHYEFEARELDAETIQSLVGEIQLGVGALSVGALPVGAPADTAVVFDVADNVDEVRTLVDYGIDGRAGTFIALQDSETRIPDPRQLEAMINQWEVQLAPTIPLSLSMEIGAGQLTLELANLTVDALTVDVGTGEGFIDMRGIVEHAARMRVDIGLGSMTIHLPTDVGVRMTANTGIGSVEAQELQYLAEEDVYVNGAYRPGAPAVELEVGAGVGSVEVLAGTEE